MAPRPANIDLTGAKIDFSKPLTSPGRNFHLDLPSPRVGEIPPALSPLDAFALHSRMLAKKFEESHQKGKRISRLPHLEIANELARRPDYFRSASGESDARSREMSEDEQEHTVRVEVSQQGKSKDQRPISHYPRFSSAAPDRSRPNTMLDDTWYECDEETGPEEADSYFGVEVPRAASPEAFQGRSTKPGDSIQNPPSLTSSVDSVHSSQPRTNTDESTSSQRSRHRLAPPLSPHHPRSNKSIASIRSVIGSEYEETGPYDDLLPPRKFSNGSGVSRPRSPLTPEAYPVCQSPSMLSDHSTYSGHYSRPSLNFSRPISGTGKQFLEGRTSLSSKPSYESRPSFEFPARESSIDRTRSPLRQTSASSKDSEGPTPRLEQNEGALDGEFLSGGEEEAYMLEARRNGAPSYIYSKYSLPRGRTVERGSLGKRDTWARHQFAWKEEEPHDAEPMPVSRPSTPPAQTSPRIPAIPPKSPARSRSARSECAGPHGPNVVKRQDSYRSHPPSPPSMSERTDSTIRAHTRNSPSADIANLSPEEHLEKGIECHSSGSLSKSTYHLRLAARAGLPTAMLLYALACRHGWGMRANQAEGVTWLKRAVDSSSLEMMDDEDPAAVSSPDRPKRKAQFALAIYELGISYMNGWGIPRDRSLAVRCFEIAGNWGDCDALTEAGFCYTQGVGCKKDLKKAAAFYRRAADGGVSMAGNSWIYKPKYMDEPVTATPVIESKKSSPASADNAGKPSRSRARTLFGRKKSPMVA